MQPQLKARGLYQLYRDEQRHEERTRRMLDELERNNRALHQSKLKLLEKLLDVQVKDDLSRHAAMADNHIFAQMNTELVKEAARAKIENEVKAHIGESRRMYSDGFMSHLDAIANADDEVSRAEVREVVDKYVDPHIETLRRANRRQPETALQSVAVAAAQVAQQRRRELDEQTKFRARKDHSSRVQRVAEGLKMLKRDIGDLTPLLHVTPVDYKCDIGKREAQINDLRSLIARQRAEEEQLLQERQTQLAIIDRDQAKLIADVDATCQHLVLLQRELETKELDLKEMAASQVPGNGSWATSTMQLEKDLSLAAEEEFHLRHEAEEVRKVADVLAVERSELDASITESVTMLARTQQEHQDALSLIEEKLTAEKNKLYRLREDEQSMSTMINDCRRRMLHRREDVRDQKRKLRMRINEVISQLSIEDRLQSALMARSLDLQTQAEKASAQAEHHEVSLRNKIDTLAKELQTKTKQISSNAETLADYEAALEESGKGGTKLSALQLQTQITQLLKEWSRVEWEASSTVAEVAARVDMNARENERSLRVMGQLVVLQEDSGTAGADIVNTDTDSLRKIVEDLYDELAQRSYREAKYTQTIRLLRERLQRRARGERVDPITRNRRITLKDRRERRETLEQSRIAREIVLQHVRRHNENAQEAATGGGRSDSRAFSASTSDVGSSAIGVASANQGTPEYAAFRSLTVNFIKKEIQPLYDTNQITKKRFIVSWRVSRPGSSTPTGPRRN